MARKTFRAWMGSDLLLLPSTPGPAFPSTRRCLRTRRTTRRCPACSGCRRSACRRRLRRRAADRRAARRPAGSDALARNRRSARIIQSWPGNRSISRAAPSSPRRAALLSSTLPWLASAGRAAEGRSRRADPVERRAAADRRHRHGGDLRLPERPGEAGGAPRRHPRARRRRRPADRPGGGLAQRGGAAGEIVAELSARQAVPRDEIFFNLPRAGPEASLRASLRRLRTDRVELMQAWNVTDAGYTLDLPREWKKSGPLPLRDTTSQVRSYDAMAKVLAREKADFLQVNYSLGARGREDAPAPAQVGAAVLSTCRRPQFIVPQGGQPPPRSRTSPPNSRPYLGAVLPQVHPRAPALPPSFRHGQAGVHARQPRCRPRRAAGRGDAQANGPVLGVARLS